MARYTEQEARDFIAVIGPRIQTEADRRGYFIKSTAIAQAIVESAAGKSVLSSKYHNYFGLKCGSAWLKAGKPSANMKTNEEYTPGKLTQINDFFRVYADVDAGVAGYYDFIAAGRYSNLKTSKTYMEYATNLKLDGYATSASYISTLCATVAKYGLSAWDGAAGTAKAAGGGVTASGITNQAAGVACPYSEPVATVRLGTKNEGVKWVQWMLNRKGYSLAVDGVAGNVTIGALMDFQRKNGLAADGICGKKTVAALKG